MATACRARARTSPGSWTCTTERTHGPRTRTGCTASRSGSRHTTTRCGSASATASPWGARGRTSSWRRADGSRWRTSPRAWYASRRAGRRSCASACSRSLTPADRSPVGPWATWWRARSSSPTSSSWTEGRGGFTVAGRERGSFLWGTGSCSSNGERPGKGEGGRVVAPSPFPGLFPASHGSLTKFVPRQPRALVAAVAGELLRIPVERLPVAAARAHAVGKRERPAHALDLARLAAHDAPALGRVIPDLEKPAVHRNVAAIHVEHDDVAGRDAHDGIPRAAAQQVGARSANASPSLSLNPSGSDVAGRHA